MRNFLITITFFAMLFAIIIWLDNSNSKQFEGRAFVIDGDTIVLAGEKLRLMGIDAPELAQSCTMNGINWPCGQASKRALNEHIGGAVVSCLGQGHDKYGRWLATCQMRGQSINAWLVKSGWAVDYGGYAAEEGEARRAKVGLWRGHFDYPQEWRRLHRSDASAEPQDMQSWFNRILAWFK